MAKAKSTSEVSEDLGLLLADTLNKKFKDHSFKTAYFLEGDSDAPVHVNEFVSTGSSILDLAISNRKDGGFPVGRITEITGLEQSGKSLLAAHALANTQKKGGMAICIDTENAFPPDFFTVLSQPLKKLPITVHLISPEYHLIYIVITTHTVDQMFYIFIATDYTPAYWCTAAYAFHTYK